LFIDSYTGEEERATEIEMFTEVTNEGRVN
jgi:hypothetical protein